MPDRSGLALTTVGIVATIFAAGTLLYTVYAITVAPQVVMFVGLTHATIGLDHVRPGGSHDPDARRPRRRGASAGSPARCCSASASGSLAC